MLSDDLTAVVSSLPTHTSVACLCRLCFYCSKQCADDDRDPGALTSSRDGMPVDPAARYTMALGAPAGLVANPVSSQNAYAAAMYPQGPYALATSAPPMAPPGYASGGSQQHDHDPPPTAYQYGAYSTAYPPSAYPASARSLTSRGPA